MWEKTLDVGNQIGVFTKLLVKQIIASYQQNYRRMTSRKLIERDVCNRYQKNCWV